MQVAGTSGKVRLDESEEEGISTEAHGEAIIQALGLARRNQVLFFLPSKRGLHTSSVTLVPHVEAAPQAQNCSVSCVVSAVNGMCGVMPRSYWQISMLYFNAFCDAQG